MFKGLSPGAVGVRAGTLEEALAAAIEGGFGGVEIDPHEVAGRVERDGADAVRDLFAQAGLQPAGWGLPTDWRGDEGAWRAGLDALPRLARAASAVGAARTMTWIMPCSDERAFEENRDFHVRRFTPIAQILADEGVSLGLEFIGPKTLRDTQTHPFIHTMGAMLDLGREIGPNVGLLLDCFHWYTSHAAGADIEMLSPDRIVYIHVNDAPLGVPADEQLDGVRGLPGATGVINIVGFLRALEKIGYDGPVTPEPFVDLSGLASDKERLQTVGAAMDDIWQKAGLK